MYNKHVKLNINGSYSVALQATDRKCEALCAVDCTITYYQFVPRFPDASVLLRSVQ